MSRADTKTIDFVAYPRARLVLKWGRRQLLSSLRTELRVRNDVTRGGASYKIPDLGILPDELLELLTPVVTRPIQAIGLGAADATAMRVAALFDGQRTLGAVAAQVGEERGWDEHHSFAYVRGVFLHLVAHGLCLPQR
jgi:hypothetical protein